MQAIGEFAQKLVEDPELVARVEAAEPGERRALLEAAGIEVTPELEEQARAAAERLGIDPADADTWAELELGEDELTALSGGSAISNVTVMPGTGGGGTYVTLPPGLSIAAAVG